MRRGDGHSRRGPCLPADELSNEELDGCSEETEEDWGPRKPGQQPGLHLQTVWALLRRLPYSLAPGRIAVIAGPRGMVVEVDGEARCHLVHFGIARLSDPSARHRRLVSLLGGLSPPPKSRQQQSGSPIRILTSSFGVFKRALCGHARSSSRAILSNLSRSVQVNGNRTMSR